MAITTTDEFIKNKQFEKKLLEYEALDKRTNDIIQFLNQQRNQSEKTFIEKLLELKPEYEKCLENNEFELKKVIENGIELTTNVKVLNEKREYMKKIDDNQRLQDFHVILKSDTAKCDIQLQSIMDKWSNIQQIVEPIEFNDELMMQKDRITELVCMKNEIIDKYCNEIERLHRNYIKTSDKQKIDIHHICQQINEQLHTFRKFYREKLELLTETVQMEWENFCANAADLWSQKFDELTTDFEYKNVFQANQTESFSRELLRIKLNHEEVTRSMRLYLEKEKQDLQVDLRQYKAKIFLDSDKFLYNYYVLQKQNHENVLILNEERRNLAKLQGKVILVRQQLNENVSLFRNESKNLNLNISKLISGIDLLERNIVGLVNNNEIKYKQVWKMHEHETLELSNKLFAVEEYLYKNLLLRPWTKPKIALFQFPNPSRPMVNKQSANLSDRFGRGDASAAWKSMNFLSNFSDHSINPPLAVPATSYSATGHILTSIEAIFKALKITDKQQMLEFLQYCNTDAICPNCQSNKKIQTQNIEETQRSSAASHLELPEKLINIIQNESIDLEQFIKDYETSSLGIDKIFAKIMNPIKPSTVEQMPPSQETTEMPIRQQAPAAKSKQCTNHILLLNGDDILPAIQRFLNERMAKPIENTCQTTTFNQFTRSNKNEIRTINVSDVQKYWSRFEQIFDNSQRKTIWHALELGLNKYLMILKKRESLVDECTKLRRQNDELRYYLQHYLPSN